MNVEIIFEEADNLTDTARKTVYLWCGTSELKKELNKLGISYTKVHRGFKNIYVLRSKSLGRFEVVL